MKYLALFLTAVLTLITLSACVTPPSKATAAPQPAAPSSNRPATTPVTTPPASTPPAAPATAAPAPAAATTSSANTPAALKFDWVSVPATVKPNDPMTVKGKTTPGTECTIGMVYASGQAATIPGLENKTRIADASGNVQWDFVCFRYSPEGETTLTMAVKNGSATADFKTTFMVKK